jgi:hypothetical protein
MLPPVPHLRTRTPCPPLTPPPPRALQESLTLAETPAPVKIARLFLASDILSNATAPVRNASR